MPNSIPTYTVASVVTKNENGTRLRYSTANLHPCSIKVAVTAAMAVAGGQQLPAPRPTFAAVYSALADRPFFFPDCIPHPPPGILAPLPPKMFRQPQSFSCNFGPEMHFRADKYQSKPNFDLCTASISNFSSRHVHWGQIFGLKMGGHYIGNQLWNCAKNPR